MIFNSIPFLVFIGIVLLVYPRLRLRAQNIFLLVASYVFYGYWDWRFNFLLLTSTVVDYWVGSRLYANKSGKSRKTLLVLSIIVNLGILSFFKYFNFFIESAAALLHTFGFQPHMPVLRIILPVGISFYTFQTMSYTIDIYRGKLKPTDSFIDFALFVSFFPQLVAGPIERASRLLPQISSPRRVTRDMVYAGLNLVLIGYFKKVCIADSLAPIVDKIFADPSAMTASQLWTGLYGFTLQIYGDFSGYTDIARGIARILGFKIMENFNAPYFSRNIAEFWRRWHISLSTWLRDYIYIPLGGNRRGKYRTYINLMATMLLGGLWHGAAWHFVIWGGLHGLFLAVHRFITKGKKVAISKINYFPKSASELLKILLTFHIVASLWVIFRAQDIDNAWIYLTGLLRFTEFSTIGLGVLFAAALVIALDLAQMWFGTHTWIVDNPDVAILRYATAYMLLVSVMIAAIAHAGSLVPFIYFQF